MVTERDEAIIGFGADADDLVEELEKIEKAAKDAETSLGGMAKEGTEGLEKLSDTAKRGGAAQKSFSDRVTQAAGALGSASTAINALIQTSSTASDSTKQLAEGFGAIATAAGSGAAAFGPWGAVISGVTAGVTLLIQHLQGLEAAQNQAAAAARAFSTDLERLQTGIARAQRIRELQEGLRGVAETTGAVTEAQQQLEARSLQVADATRRLEDSQRRLAEQQEELERVSTRNRAGQIIMSAAYTRQLGVVERVANETNNLEREVRGFTVALGTAQTELDAYNEGLSESERLAREAANAQAEAANNVSRIREILAEQQRRQEAARDRARQKRLDEIRSEAQLAQQQVRLEWELAQERIDAEQFARNQIVQTRIALNNMIRELDRRNAEAAINLARTTAARQLDIWSRQVDRRMEALDLLDQAGREFSNSWSDSQESMIRSFRETNRAHRALGQDVMSTNDLIAMSMAQTGNQALKSLGEDFANAFAQAVTAAITGAQSFEDSLILMTQALLEQLTQQAVVQAIVELASGLSATARREYDAAAAHFASMAAWIAVGAAAGIGLAIISPEAEKVKAKQNAREDARRDEDQDRREMEQQQQQPVGGNLTFVFNDKPFATRDELQKMLRHENQQIQRRFGAAG